ncbi:MAG: hypothetical protein QCI00_09285, partial [Candidatus Thermoplasmatota archaeon]|nr:hypothetical protein [Candidatus Thermoplasmatota archaeon]
KPNYDTLSRIELLMDKGGYPTDDLTVRIVEGTPWSPGDILFTGAISPDDVPVFGNADWVSVDIGIAVTPGEEYHIYIEGTADHDGWDHMSWYFCSQVYRPYEDGSFWYTRDFGAPYEFYNWDFAFRTFGMV